MTREKLLECLDAHGELIESVKRLAREPQSPALDAGIVSGLRQAAENLDELAEQVTS